MAFSIQSINEENEYNSLKPTVEYQIELLEGKKTFSP